MSTFLGVEGGSQPLLPTPPVSEPLQHQSQQQQPFVDVKLLKSEYPPTSSAVSPKIGSRIRKDKMVVNLVVNLVNHGRR